MGWLAEVSNFLCQIYLCSVLFLVEYLKTQWKYLKDNFKRCITNRNKLTRSGAAGGKLPQCKYFEQMQFVLDKVSNKSSVSNIDMSVDDDELPLSPSPETSSPKADTAASINGKRECEEAVFVMPSAKRKNRDNLAMQVDSMLVKTLANLHAPHNLAPAKTPSEEPDADYLFCNSLTPVLQNLPSKKNRLAKIKIQQLLFGMEFEDDLYVVGL